MAEPEIHIQETLMARGEEKEKADPLPQPEIDPEAAFPTAQQVAAMRAVDARSEAPLIGSNINAGPDLAAAELAGEVGWSFMREYGQLVHLSDAALGISVAHRSMYFDEKIMESVADGVCQVVILAAGLDARAWRLPLPASVTVFEVDMPRTLRYKDALEAKVLTMYHPECARVTVGADLSTPEWMHKLTAAGFDPEQKSIFMLEGLLMYLPSFAPSQLLASISSLMSPRSIVVGDSFCNLLDNMDKAGVQALLAKYGTQWTFEVTSRSDMERRLSEAGLHITHMGLLVSPDPDFPRDCIPFPTLDAEDEKKAAQATERVLAMCRTLGPAWPEPAITFIRGELETDGTGHRLAITFVKDVTDHNGLRDASISIKRRVLTLLLETGMVELIQTKLANIPPTSVAKETGYLVYTATKE